MFIPVLLAKTIERWNGTRIWPRLLLISAALALLSLVAGAAYQLAPQTYHLTISSGGDITSNRHFLAKGLQEAAAPRGVQLALHTTYGIEAALAQVASGKLDMALVQGDAGQHYAELVHVATLAPELLHFAVRPGIASMAGLRGKQINLGSKSGSLRLVAGDVLQFAGLRADIDYVELNISTERLLALRSERLPDAIVVTSFAPSALVDYLVRQHGYTLLDLPFAAAFALRHGWATDSVIPALMYNVGPPVPARTLQTIGTHLRLVANRRVDRRALQKILESLYGPELETRLRLHLDEKTMLASAVYRPSDGSKAFMERNRPLLSYAMLDRIKAAIGLLVSLISTVVVVIKWVRSKPHGAAPPGAGDPTLSDYLEQLSCLEAAVQRRATASGSTLDDADQLDARLSAIKAGALRVLGQSALDQAGLPHIVLLSIADARSRIERLRLEHVLGLR